MTPDQAYAAGLAHGRDWIGPNGDGSMGALSADFIRQAAQQYACGYDFRDLRDGPTPDDQALADAYRRGFYAA